MPGELEDMTESMHDVMSLGGDVDKLASFYRDWAAGYDEDVASHGYGLPSMMVTTLERAVRAHGSSPRFEGSRAAVLDAGCGTGLVGVELAAAGYTTIDGVDLSPEMVDLARARTTSDGRAVYRHVEGGVDLTIEPPERLRRRADIVTVGGVFTVGHVPPDSLEKMSMLVRSDGLLVVSTRRAYHEETDFVAVSERLVDEGTLDLIVHLADAPYTMDSTGDYWAYRVAS